MKKILTLAAFAMFSTAISAAPQELKTTADSLNYVVGLMCGESFDTVLEGLEDKYGITFDLKKVFETARQVADDELADSSANFAFFLGDYLGNRLPAQRLGEAEAFLKELKAQNPDVKESKSGLVYQIIAPGNSRRAQHGNDVVVRYTKTFIDGTPAYRNNSADSQNSDESVVFKIGDQIAGCEEGLKLVGVGGKVKLWLHPKLAQGAYGDHIPENSLLIFEYELLGIHKN